MNINIECQIMYNNLYQDNVCNFQQDFLLSSFNAKFIALYDIIIFCSVWMHLIKIWIAVWIYMTIRIKLLVVLQHIPKYAN